MSEVVRVYAVVLAIVLMSGVASAAWHEDWDYRTPIEIDGNTEDLTDYQVNVTIQGTNSAAANYIDFDKVLANGTDIRFTNSDQTTEIDFWIDEWNDTAKTATVWIEVPSAPTVGNTTVYAYYGKVGGSGGSDGNDTFEFFGGFSDTIPATYLTGWQKSASNPLQDIGISQGWFVTVYNDYDSKFYLFVQKDNSPSNDFECWSFSIADAETPANWIDEGVIYTSTETWEAGHIEPHGIIWETQSMADAREGVGAGLGTQKWRIYHTGRGTGEYSTGFIYADESDMTNWTAYSANPVYPYDASYGYPDSKAVIYNNEVWILMGRYTGNTPIEAYFTHSVNGIDNWTDVDTNYSTTTLGGTLHVLNGGMNIYDEPNDGEMKARFTIDGTVMVDYSGNPTMTGTEAWEDIIGWISVTQTKDRSCLISGDYYMWYWGVTSSVHKLCLAKTQTTIEEQSDVTLDIDKWETISGTTVDISNGILSLNGHTTVNRGIYTKNYNHSASGVIIDYEGKAGTTNGWVRGVGSLVDTSSWNRGGGGIASYPTKQLKVYNYTGTTATNDHDFDSDGWYDISTVLKPHEIEIQALGTNVSVANILESHPLAINAYKDRYLQKFRVRKYTPTEPAAVTTSAFRGYNKIFAGVVNIISVTDHVSYSTEPDVSNLVDMIAYPSSLVNITTTELTTSASIVLDGIGTTNLTMQMPNTALTYAATYDGNPCNDAACSFTQSNGELNFSLTLGSEHTIEITEEDGDNSTYATHLTATTPGTAANSVTTTETCGNASFGAATLTGGSDSDSEWAGSDVPTGVDIWRDGAGMIAIVVLALLAGIVIVFLRGGGIGEGLTISPNIAISLSVGLLVLLAVFSIAPIFGDKIDSVADLGRETYATGRLTFVLGGTTADGETVTIDATTLEFDRSADGVTAGRVPVNISDGTAATASLNLTAAINGNATLAAVVAARRDVST